MRPKIPKPYILLTAFLALAVLLSACWGGADQADGNNGEVGYNYAGNNAGNSGYYAPGEPEEGPPAFEEPSSGGGVPASAPDTIERLVIMNADMSIVAQNPAHVMDAVAEMAEAYGGYVVSSNLRQYTGEYGIEYPHATITIRVPANRLQQTMDEIEAMALEVTAKNLAGDDVTAEYTDLQSRLRNLEDAAAQLRQIMEQGKNTEEVLAVYNKLVEVTEEIELVKGQIQYYEQASALSSLSLIISANLITPTPTPTATPTPTPTPVPWSAGPAFDNAKDDLVDSFQGWTEGLIRFFVFVVPAAVFNLGPWALVLFFVGRWAYRRMTSLTSKAPPKKET